MKSNLMILAALVVFSIACSKSKYQTKPQIKIKSTNTSVVPLNGTFVATLEFTDKEGDLQDSFYVVKVRLNQRTTVTLRDTLMYQIPFYDDKTKGIMELTLEYQNILSAQNPPTTPGNPPRAEPDSLLVKFYARDRGGHVSDTVSTNVIVIR